MAGRTSSFSFKGKSVKIEEIGRELHVAAVLEGSVRKSGDQVRVTAQLINTADGYHLWTASYDRRLTEIFAMQDEIARSVVAALKVKLLPGQRPAARERRTTKPEAYNEYLVAQQFANRYTKDGDRLAVAFYEKAVALDPGYAPAWAGLARARHKFAGYYSVTVDDLVRSEERALAEAEKAIALDPDLAEGYGVRGKLRSIFKRDWAGGQADLAHALALDPGNATTLASQADLIASLGRLREAIALQRRATELDPLNADTWTFLGLMYRSSGELDLARQAMNRLLEIAPESAGGQCGLASTSLLEGQPAAALSSSGGCRFEFLRLQNVAMAQHDLGRSRESQEALDTLIATHSLAAFQIAQVYAWRGERDRAFDWLERAYERHDESLRFLKHSALLRSLRGDPRFTVLLRKMNLPVD